MIGGLACHGRHSLYSRHSRNGVRVHMDMRVRMGVRKGMWKVVRVGLQAGTMNILRSVLRKNPEPCHVDSPCGHRCNRDEWWCSYRWDDRLMVLVGCPICCAVVMTRRNDPRAYRAVRGTDRPW
jgi:hypothetical protein